MPNPFKKVDEKEYEEIEGLFGCYTSGCGKTVGDAVYIAADELVQWTCPSGHPNEVSMRLE